MSTRKGRPAPLGLLILLASTRLFAGFSSAEVFLPSIGRITGQGGAQFFTTIWATNLTSAPESFTLFFLKAGQANPSPASFSDTLAPGQTKVYDNVVQTKLGLANALGAARVTSTGEILVAERIFDQEPGTDLGQTEGLFFAGVPASFAISAGQSASIQGVDQGSSEDFRYNFALVETAGASADVNVQVFDGSGVLLGQKAFPLAAFEQIQPNVADVVPGFSSTNARITATVTGGSGHVLLAGAQVANVSQDSSGFEMSFRDDLLGGGGTAGVTSLNGLTGALSLTAGNGISITPSGSSIEVAFTGGGSSGITSVTHDGTLAGKGTGGAPLGVAVPLVLGSVNGSALGIGMTADTGAPAAVALSVTGSTSGKATGLSIDVAGTLTNNDATAIHASVHGQVRGVVVSSEDSPAVVGQSTGSGTGVVGDAGSGLGVSGSTHTGEAGVRGENGGTDSSTAGVYGTDGSVTSKSLGQKSAGVRGESGSNIGVLGVSREGSGVEADSVFGFGVIATTETGQAAVFGVDLEPVTADTAGVFGIDGTSGLSGISTAGVRGESNSQLGVVGLTGSGQTAVLGRNNSTSTGTSGVFGIDGTGATGLSAVLSAGVRGDSKTNIGVLGISSNFGVIGRLANGTQGELGSFRGGHSWGLFTLNDIAAANGFFSGSLTATNLKSFVEPHPSDPTKEIRFVCLEGPESGTYFRGSGHIVGGFAKIPVPDSFRWVSDEKNITVQLTPTSGLAVLACVRKGLDEIVVQGSSDVEFDYMVNGVRKAYRDFEAIQENQSFVPDGPDDRRFALYAPEIQRRLVATGIYNADGTVNLETARRMGWDRRWPTEAAAR